MTSAYWSTASSASLQVSHGFSAMEMYDLRVAHVDYSKLQMSHGFSAMETRVMRMPRGPCVLLQVSHGFSAMETNLVTGLAQSGTKSFK